MAEVVESAPSLFDSEEYKSISEKIHTTLEDTGQLHMDEFIDIAIALFSVYYPQIQATPEVKSILIDGVLKQYNYNGIKYEFIPEKGIIKRKMEKLD